MIAKILLMIALTCHGFPEYIDLTQPVPLATLHTEQWCPPEGSFLTGGSILLTLTATQATTTTVAYAMDPETVAFLTRSVTPPSAGFLVGTTFVWGPHEDGATVEISLTNGPCWCGILGLVAAERVPHVVFMPRLHAEELVTPTPTPGPYPSPRR